MTTVGMKIVDLCIARQFAIQWCLDDTHLPYMEGMKSIFSNNLPNMVMHTRLSQEILFLCPKGPGNCF